MKIEKITVRSNQEEDIEGLTPSYPYVYHSSNINEVSIPWHWHEEVEFCYVKSGVLEVYTIDRKYMFKENDAFFINTKVLCSMKAKSGVGDVYLESHLFHPIFLSGHYKSVFETQYVAPVIQNRNVTVLEIRTESKENQELLKRLRQVSALNGQFGYEMLTRNLFSEIWLYLIQKIENAPSQAIPNIRNQERMQAMMSYIHNHYHEKISLENIAKSAMISSRECIRCFQNCIHKAPIEYLTDYRLDIAKKLLKESDYSVTEIGLYSGFSSNAYFGKVFRERIGMTPNAYRKNGALVSER